jgi:hypothetical protein
MGYTALVTSATSRGSRYEYDLVVSEGQTIAIRNNDYSYGETQYWGVLLCADYDLFDGANVLVYSQQLLYSKAEALKFSSPIGGSTFPALYVPTTYKQQYLNFTLFAYYP